MIGCPEAGCTYGCRVCMLIGVDVPETDADAEPNRDSGVDRPSLSSATSFSSFGLSCCHEVLLGSLGIAIARR